ncbi:hypothetical protein [Methanoculleus sp. UBA303]|uniref:hypothetical protein n=1 Tax=Methanoculleus sp. UBA303 TaxID=1915497 RepID=UPI0025FD9996|nr:hypothetical protein [Methanoculleus sp. UBA303]
MRAISGPGTMVATVHCCAGGAGVRHAGLHGFGPGEGPIRPEKWYIVAGAGRPAPRTRRSGARRRHPEE